MTTIGLPSKNKTTNDMAGYRFKRDEMVAEIMNTLEERLDILMDFIAERPGYLAALFFVLTATENYDLMYDLYNDYDIDEEATDFTKLKLNVNDVKGFIYIVKLYKLCYWLNKDKAIVNFPDEGYDF